MAFIVFEGLDGAGKSSLIQLLANDLTRSSMQHIITREPGGTALGEELRTILLRTDGEAPVARAELLLYQAIRAQHVENKIKPALKMGSWVICDRYTASSIAFQAGGRGISENDIKSLNDFSTDHLQPQLFVLLDLPVEESLKRIQKRVDGGQNKDRFEQEEKDFHERIRTSYLKQSKEDANLWLVLDARKSSEDMYKELKSKLIEKKWLKS
ncbi:MAG: dTMP kinase [Bdellovibrionales bacterium]|nr:dTMP kinase [Bdellovibrionales bacterium]